MRGEAIPACHASRLDRRARLDRGRLVMMEAFFSGCFVVAEALACAGV